MAFCSGLTNAGLLEMSGTPAATEEDASRRAASFFTQANALMRKNATLQMRNMGTNVRLIVYPVLLCLMLKGVQDLITGLANLEEAYTDCSSERKYISLMGDNLKTCPMPHPPKWPALFQVPAPQFRAARGNSSTSIFSRYQDLPLDSCKKGGNCPATMFITGQNRSLAQRLGQNLFGSEPFSLPGTSSPLEFPMLGTLNVSSNYILGTTEAPSLNNYFESAFTVIASHMCIVLPKCKPNLYFTVSVAVEGRSFEQDVECLEALQLWRDSSLDINHGLFVGYIKGSLKKEINEFLGAYDFLDTNENNFNVTVWYNGSYSDHPMIRVLRAVNAASNSYLQFSKGAHVKILLEFVKEMAKGVTGRSKMNISALLGPLFFTWIIELLFPVMLIYLVYEKQKNLRMIMKMHGLGDCAYWMITYAYFLLISFFYVFSLVLFGSVIGLKSFTLIDYSVQFVFYFANANLQIVFVFLVSIFFSDVNTASVLGYLYVFSTGLLGPFLFERLIQDTTFPRVFIQIIEIIPAFSLYRGLYELGQYSFEVEYIGVPRMTWENVNNDEQGLKGVLKLMIAEWIILLIIACYSDQVFSNGSGVRKHPLWFLPSFHWKPKRNMERQGYDVLVNVEKPDVSQEREMVESLVREAHKSHAIICHRLKKVYPQRYGNPEKHAVQGLSLSIPRGECFGMLGPNGAGKTSFINMMTGLTTPTSGTAFFHGLDITKDMDEVYTSMGVCPQHDLIWETLTGREHLLFYGRLKNLKGAELTQAVEESLRRVSLSDKGVGDKLADTYSGGMKRRLSVAISLIGNPRVVYMDEPSTGLDPASRKNLWDVVQCSKKDKAIILTTHSMEEAEFLCDRVGIFVNGNLQCLGSPRELRARYGGYFVFTMTTPSNQEEEVEKLVRRLSQRANKLYHLSGTQKFQLPKGEVKLADVFREVEDAKRQVTIQAWGLSDATLEDVFINVARGAQSVHELS